MAVHMEFKGPLLTKTILKMRKTLESHILNSELTAKQP